MTFVESTIALTYKLSQILQNSLPNVSSHADIVQLFFASLKYLVINLFQNQFDGILEKLIKCQISFPIPAKQMS